MSYTSRNYKRHRKRCSYCKKLAVEWDRSIDKYACKDHEKRLTNNSVTVG